MVRKKKDHDHCCHTASLKCCENHLLVPGASGSIETWRLRNRLQIACMLRQSVPTQLPSEFTGFTRLPAFDSVEFRGIIPPSLYHYQLNIGTETRFLFCAWMVLKEESLAWNAFRELLGETFKMAASQMRGFFGLELLFMDLSGGFSSFHPGNLAQLIINHSKKLEPGKQTLIRYASLWMILSQRMAVDWGKIDFKSRVEVISKPEQLDLRLKKFLRATADLVSEARPPLFALFDLGQAPVLKFGAEEQTARIRRWLEGFQKAGAPVPEIYICQQGKGIEIAAQFGLRNV